VSVQRHRLRVELHDGRAVAVPLAWFPKLQQATPEARQAWALNGRGDAVVWESLDVSIPAAELLRTA
jgi:hypothetical protein